ncbi:Maltose/maltodextrin transport ATP-binding protein MalK [hydrothermal vent metagenome]|uniref:Maltose/maltodextrin transport ATP-binding protein MalK n=1 Tax=hydrothermal vent metagenome TaxID=652676 RepID=A0A3B0SB87_9ZZZZ
MTSLTVKNLVKSFDQTEIIHNINFSIQSGEFIVLVGPSGCGKSTILRMIAGLEDVTAGNIHIGGDDVTKTAASRRGIAMVFQSYALYPHMTVEKNLSFSLRNMKYSKKHIEEKVRHAADILQLSDYLDRLPSHLSGGQRQRVAIGRTIVRDPKIFLFDEPLSNLDTELRVQMRHELSKLHRTLGSTMIYVTHDQVEAMTLADRIIVLDQGNISQMGTPLELYNHPKNSFTASFIGSPRINLLKGRVTENNPGNLTVNLKAGQDIRLAMDIPALNAGDEVTLGLRPEHITPFVNEGDVALDMCLDEIETLGDCTYIYAKLFDEIDIRVKLHGQHIFKGNDQLTLGINPENILLFDVNGDAITTREEIPQNPSNAIAG